MTNVRRSAAFVIGVWSLLSSTALSRLAGTRRGYVTAGGTGAGGIATCSRVAARRTRIARLRAAAALIARPAPLRTAAGRGCGPWLRTIVSLAEFLNLAVQAVDLLLESADAGIRVAGA